MQPPTAIQNHPQPSTTTHSHPQITQKRQNLSHTVTLLHLDANTETDVDFDSDMYVLYKPFYLLFFG